MDEDAAVQVAYTTIDANKASLLSGLNQNDQERTLGYLSDTWIGAPTGYYAVKIHCETPVERAHPEFYNKNSPTPYEAEYPMLIGVADYVVFDPNDVSKQFGSTAHTNFRDFTDRIVALFRRDQKWFPNASATPRFRLPDESPQGRVVTKRNELPQPLDDGAAILYCEIRFRFLSCHTT